MKDTLRHIVAKLAVKGFRKAGGDSWEAAMTLMHQLISAQCKEPEITVWEDKNGIKYRNFSLLFKGKNPKKIVSVAHYDSFEDTPGADDNASGISALFAFAEYFKKFPPKHSVILAAFDGEELGLKGSEYFVKNSIISSSFLI